MLRSIIATVLISIAGVVLLLALPSRDQLRLIIGNPRSREFLPLVLICILTAALMAAILLTTL
jgi:hypothetical protein